METSRTFSESSTISRRHALALGLVALVVPGAGMPANAAANALKFGAAKAFSWETLQQEAVALAARPFAEPRHVAAAHAVDYDALNHVQYRSEAELWPGSRQGAMRFFLLSRYADTPINMHVVDGGGAREILFDNNLFTMPKNSPARAIAGKNGGFSGFRIMNPSGVGDWIAWQGASYFRSAGPLDQYGLSARALALDTAVMGAEEFPLFRDFWVEQGDDAIIIYALLEGPRVTGAWRFINRHDGKSVVQDVDCTFVLRADVERLGIAPLTSMYWYGEADPGPHVDWRPEIHDSDGLLMLNGNGEQLWRPLVNPPHVQVNAFSDPSPKGFGLLQRDRDYDHYEDDGVFYHKRPSLWVEPRGDWGPGAVELVELPTRSETEDNIVAFWRPAEPARAGSRHDLGYRLSWIADEPVASPLGRTIFTRRGLGGRPGLPPEKHVTKFVVDFEGKALEGKTRDSGVETKVSVNGGKLLSAIAYPVVERDNRWRLMIEVIPEEGNTMDLRALLMLGDTPLTETWLYQLHA